QTALGVRFIPADAILEQFARARRECESLDGLAVWAPILPQYGPALLTQCENAKKLARELVTHWLAKYMFAGQTDPKRAARKAARKLAAHGTLKSHRRHIGRDRARNEIGLEIEDLEDDKDFAEKVMSVFHATTITFDSTAALKIIENQRGDAFIKSAKPVMMAPPQGAPQPRPPKPGNEIT
ncbi:MAG: serine protease, partial [Planctomycetes bacterium]|nr:serine protease [Planctomycetota bacterium]